ncbi:MAG TPA: hypothetical protein VK889_08355, partial [Solirubrobacterales bacterium]|nr:hypothetical protein [Solirubrobacterales bacterium]
MQERMQNPPPIARPLTTLALAVVLVAGLMALAPAGAGAVQVQRLIAPGHVCPDLGTEQPAAAQEQAMRCMTNFARGR